MVQEAVGLGDERHRQVDQSVDDNQVLDYRWGLEITVHERIQIFANVTFFRRIIPVGPANLRG